MQIIILIVVMVSQVCVCTSACQSLWSVCILNVCSVPVCQVYLTKAVTWRIWACLFWDMSPQTFFGASPARTYLPSSIPLHLSYFFCPKSVVGAPPMGSQNSLGILVSNKPQIVCFSLSSLELQLLGWRELVLVILESLIPNMYLTHSRHLLK